MSDVAIVPGWTLAFGEIRHARHGAVRHAFRYDAFFAAGPADTLDGTASGNWLFGINRRALLSFDERDHGNGSGVKAWLHELLESAGIAGVTRIRYEGFIRVLGYAFKPVSFWHCSRDDGATLAIVAEVNNTFGDRHCYLLTAPDLNPLRAGQTLNARKQFHVSPFFDVQGAYRFRFMTRGMRSVMRIDHVSDESPSAQLLLATSMSGVHRPANAAAAWRALVDYPFFTLGVIVRIHWHALRLVAKRVRIFSRPLPSVPGVTAGHPAPTDD